MCGIVGVYSFHERIESSVDFIKWANSTMERRGPDSEGIWSNDKNYISGFRRLAIRDLSPKANQPMLSDCGNYVLTFNGEIYNTDYLRRELRGKDVRFKTTSDTEILLYSLIHFGINETLNKVDGIFAFAFYNTILDTVTIARDRAGIKPLYYGHTQDGIIYSSQYDHIINHPFIQDKTIDPGALGSYLQLGYMAEGKAIISDTFLLPHGHYLKVENGKVSELTCYFDYPINSKSRNSISIYDCLSGAVESQLVSDVLVGTFMSGGVDSPLVSYFANRRQQIKSFNIGVDDPAFDESIAARLYAEIFKTDHFLKMITEKDLLATIDDNTQAYSEPFADYSSIPTLILSKFAKEKVTVVLSGDGGDELFWGYPRNSKVMKQHPLITANKGYVLAKILFEKFTNASPRTVSGKLMKYKSFTEFYYHTLFVTGAAHWVSKIFKEEPLLPYFYEKVLHQSYNQKDLEACMNVMRKLEFDLHLQRILIKVDRASMHHSLEVRVPLLSNSVIDQSLGYRYGDCIQNEIGKYNLKETLASVSDEKLVFATKKGFSIPLAKWIRQDLSEDVKEKILNLPPEIGQYIERKEVEKMVDQHYSGAHDWSWNIWVLYSLVNWYTLHRKKQISFSN